MIVSAHQPYFAPHAGFFLKALLADVLVLMDAVQFPQGTTWLTRNRFKNDRGTTWLTVPVWKKGLGQQAIKDVRICNEGRWRAKHLATLRTAYSRAPFFEAQAPFLEDLLTGLQEHLMDLNIPILRHLASFLGLKARIVLLSELHIKEKEPRLSVEVARATGASVFLAQASAQKVLEQVSFREAGVALHFFKSRPPVYPQLWGDFIPNLSVFDLVFNCGPAAAGIIRGMVNDMNDVPATGKAEG